MGLQRSSVLRPCITCYHLQACLHTMHMQLPSHPFVGANTQLEGAHVRVDCSADNTPDTTVCVSAVCVCCVCAVCSQ